MVAQLGCRVCTRRRQRLPNTSPPLGLGGTPAQAPIRVHHAHHVRILLYTEEAVVGGAH